MDRKRSQSLNLPTSGELIEIVPGREKEVDFDWSKNEYSPREFDELHGTSLPCIARITMGYMPANEENAVGSGEMVFIFGKKTQKRVVMKDCENRYISIPMDHPIKFHIIKPNGKWESAKSLKQILEGDRKSVKMKKPLMLCYENKPELVFCITKNAEVQSPVQFGEMQYIYTYGESMLFGFHILQERVVWISSDDPSFIMPVYYPVKLTVAKGIHGMRNETWNKMFKKISERLTNISLDGHTNIICKEITVLSEGSDPSDDNDYAYIPPIQYIVPTIGRKSIFHLYEQLNDTTQNHDSHKTNNCDAANLCAIFANQSLPKEEDHAIKNFSVKDIDVTSFTIGDVCGLLAYLRMDKYSESFRNNMIDGNLLVDIINRKILSELGLSALDSLKLWKYIKEQWRPSTGSGETTI